MLLFSSNSLRPLTLFLVFKISSLVQVTGIDSYFTRNENVPVANMRSRDDGGLNADVVLELADCDEDEAKDIGRHFGLLFKCRVFDDHSFFHYQSTNFSKEKWASLTQHEKVVWLQRQHPRRRQIRGSLRIGLAPNSNERPAPTFTKKIKNSNSKNNIFDIFKNNKRFLRILEPNLSNFKPLNWFKDYFNFDDKFKTGLSSRKLPNLNGTIENIKRSFINHRFLDHRPRSRPRHGTTLDEPAGSLNDQKTRKTHEEKNEDNSNEENKVIFNDPQFYKQWYLLNLHDDENAPGYDLNVSAVWKRGITGRGVNVSVLDDGIQAFNREIARNYNHEVSFSLLDDKTNRHKASKTTHRRISDDFEIDFPSSVNPSATAEHGTYCAGVIAGVANNEFCGVGVAYNSRIGGVRMFNGEITDVKEARALSSHLQKISIFSSSWGPVDDGASVDGPGKLTSIALRKGALMGRGGKGVLYVWASGNGGYQGDNCNLDGFASSPYVISVSSLTDEGLSTSYSEPCASTLASVFVEKRPYRQRTKGEGKLDPRRIGQIDGILVPSLKGGCKSSFHGTSAAAPLAAGVLALILEVNPNLGYRDVQHLIVRTSQPTKEAIAAGGWTQNGVGRWIHLRQGYGAINAGNLAALASKWVNVSPLQTVTLRNQHPLMRVIKHHRWTNVTLRSNEVTISQLEHVILRTSIRVRERGKMRIYLVSPMGTESQVLTERSRDLSEEGFSNWDFVSAHFWDENPTGEWRICIFHRGATDGELREMSVILRGTG